MSPKPLGFQISPTLFNRLLLGFVLMLLLALRLKVFLHANSLMIDEANLAMNLAERNFEGLWRSLDYEQYAPPLFLSWAKASTALLGMNEYALRMPAMVSAILCMYLIVQLGRKAPLKLSPPYIALVLILFGSSHTILLQGDLLKQYTTDAMWSLLFVNLALKYSFRFILSPGGKLFWTLIGSLAIWCSMPSVFLLATIGVYYFYQASKEDKSILLLQHLLIPGFIWVAQFAIYFFTILKSDAESDYLQTYHQRYFFDYAFWEIKSWSQNAKVLSGIIDAYLGKTVIVYIWVFLAALAGGIQLARKKEGLLILLAMPGLCAIAASLWQYYSCIPRLLLFYIPLFYFLIALGVRYLWKVSTMPGRALLLLSTLFISLQMSGWTYFLPHNPCLLEETREVMDELSPPSPASSTIFVNHSGAPAVRFYTRYHDEKASYKAFYTFRSLQWNEDIVEESKAFFRRNPEQTLWIIWGHEPNKRIQETALALKAANLKVMHDIEKVHARAMEFRAVR
jgi:hypothetical protein